MVIIEVEPLKKVIRLTLQAQFIKPFEPTNLLLIGNPETAKTSALTLSRKKDFVYFTNEITAKMLIDMVFPSIEKGDIKAIVIPDLLNCIEKQKSTRQQFLMLIKSLIEEGFTEIQTYHKRYSSKTPIRASLITAMTSSDFRDIRKYLMDVGLLSRFLPFSYDYPITKIRRILEFVEDDGKYGKEEDAEFRISKGGHSVAPNPTLFAKLEIVSTKLGQQYGGYGFRAQERLQRLCKANAILDGRKVITEADIDSILELARWMNFEFNPI